MANQPQALPSHLPQAHQRIMIFLFMVRLFSPRMKKTDQGVLKQIVHKKTNSRQNTPNKTLTRQNPKPEYLSDLGFYHQCKQDYLRFLSRFLNSAIRLRSRMTLALFLIFGFFLPSYGLAFCLNST